MEDIALNPYVYTENQHFNDKSMKKSKFQKKLDKLIEKRQNRPSSTQSTQKELFWHQKEIIDMQKQLSVLEKRIIFLESK